MIMSKAAMQRGEREKCQNTGNDSFYLKIVFPVLEDQKHSMQCNCHY